MLEMTSYEMLDLANGHVSASVDDLNRALALGSAYLMCAYKAGKELTRLQVSIINAGFLVFVGQALIGASSEFAAAMALTEAAWVGESTANAAVDLTTAVTVGSAAVAISSASGLVAIGAILACLTFMWSVRHPKTG